MLSNTGLQVLVVEDESGMQELLANALRARGHTVMVCADAESAWAEFQARAYPLVLLDWILPGMQGDELCRRMRAHPHGTDSVILMVTVRKAAGDLEAILAAGADDYLAKPVPIAEIGVRLTVMEQQVARALARRQAEEQNLRLGRIIDRSSNEVYAFDAQTLKIVQANRSAQANLGYTLEELRRMTLAELRPEFSSVAFEAIVAPLRSGREVEVRFETTHRRKDGSLYSAEARLALSPPESPPVFVCVLQDITDRRLAEQRLREAKEAAEAGNRAKSEFLATVSHELRTPLHAIGGFTEIAMHTPGLPAAVRGYLTDAMDAAAILRRHIDDLLHASRLEYGKLPLIAAPFDLESCVQDTIEMLSVMAEAKGLELILRFPAAVPRAVIGDARRLGQVLTNLVDNAIRFTEAGHVLVDVNGRASGPGRAKYCIAVEDTGIGVSETQRTRIFEKFTQADGSITRAHDGLGLGLSLSRQIIELMGGRIELENTSAAGSRFEVTLTLPLDRQAPNEAPGKALRLRDARVLIVEDKALTAGIMHEYVQGWRMRNGIARTGEEALRTLRLAREQGDPYRFAIIAVPLPDMSIEKLTGELRADPGLRETLVLILLPADGELSPMPRLEVPVVGCMTRPVSPSQLLDAIVTVSAAWVERVAPDHKVLAAAPRPDASTECRVLVVEDNAFARRTLAMLLETTINCRVEVAENGAVGVTKAAGEDFDIVFMDLQMPLMDGFAATERIRALSGPRGRVPIVALTAHAGEAYRTHCLRVGMDGYLVKPTGLDELRRALARWARRPATPAVGGEAKPEPRDADRDGQ